MRGKVDSGDDKIQQNFGATSRHDRSISYKLVLGLLIAWVVFEATSVLEWISYPYFPDSNLFFAQAEWALFKLFAPFSVLTLIIALYLSLGKIAAEQSGSINRQLRVRLRSVIVTLGEFKRIFWLDTTGADSGLVTHFRIIFTLAIALGALLSVTLYRPDLNPTMALVGVDAHFYAQWLTQMVQQTPGGAISYAMGTASWGSRPMLLIPLYLVVLSGLLTVNQAVEALPFVLAPLLAVATFAFVREGTQNNNLASTSSLLTLFSFTTTLGLWAGFYTNWLALAETYLFFAVFLSCVRLVKPSKVVLLTLASLAILLTHPWTWLLVLSVAIVNALTLWKNEGKVKLFESVLVVVVSGIILDLVKMLAFGASSSAQDASLNLVHASTSEFLNFWPNVVDGLLFTYTGLLGNTAILGLSLFAIFFLKIEDHFDRLLITWVGISSIPFLLLPAILQTRIVYDLPFPILTAMGSYRIVTRLRERPLISNLVFVLIVLVMANYTLRTLVELVVSPF